MVSGEADPDTFYVKREIPGIPYDESGLTLHKSVMGRKLTKHSVTGESNMKLMTELSAHTHTFSNT